MDNPSQTAALSRWRVPLPFPEQVFVDVVRHPGFAEAGRTLSRNMLAAEAEDWAFDHIAKDAGRYVTAVWAFHLHSTGGLTLARLKEVSLASGVLSAGRARDLLNVLQFLGYFTPEPETTPTRYLPTDAFVASFRRQSHAVLGAARFIEPEASLVIERLDDPGVTAQLIRIEGQSMLGSLDPREQKSPFARVFIDRYAGMQFVHCILMSAEEGDSYPPRNPVRVSLAAISRRLGVSRAHLARMLKAAEAEGLISRPEAGALCLEPVARASIRYTIALRMITFLWCGARVAEG